MSYTIIAPNGTASVTLTANQKIAVQSNGSASVLQDFGFPNYPDQYGPIKNLNNETWVSSAFASGALLQIQAGPLGALFSVGLSPVISAGGLWQLQGAPGALDATGTLTAELMLGGIVTTTAATNPTVATPSTGALIDSATSIAIGESFNFSVINTDGAAKAFQISVGGGVAGFTIGAGSMTVAAGTSGRFNVRKTAAATYVISRVG